MAIGLKHDGNGKVLELRDSVDGAIYPTQPNAVVWHDGNSTNEKRASLLALLNVPLKYLKWVANDVSEMSQGEKDAVDAADAAAAITATRTGAKNSLTGFNSASLVERAILDIIKDEFNIVRKWTRDFKTEVAAATNLANLQTRVATLPTLNDRTLYQIKTAIKNRVDDGTVDSE